MNIMILGASGFIGTNLTASLAPKNTLTLVSRTPKKLKLFPNTTALSWNDLTTNPDILKATDVIINLCGQSILGFWTESYQKKLISSRVTPLQTLNTLLNKINHRPHIICASGVGAYGYQKEDEYQDIYQEGDVAKHTTLLSTIAHKAENTLDPVLQKNTCYLRFGVVLSKKGGSFPLMKLPHYFGLGMVVGDGKQPFSWVALTDVLSIIEHAIQKDLVGIYNVVTPINDSNRTFNQALAKAMHRPLWLRLPTFAAKCFGKMFKATILQGQNVSSDKLKLTGYQFKITNISELLQSE